MDILSYSFSTLSYRHYMNFLQNPPIIFISINVNKPYMCDPLGSYSWLVSNSIAPILHSG